MTINEKIKFVNEKVLLTKRNNNQQAHDILFDQGIYVHSEQHVLIIPLTDVCYLLIDGEIELKHER